MVLTDCLIRPPLRSPTDRAAVTLPTPRSHALSYGHRPRFCGDPNGGPLQEVRSFFLAYTKETDNFY